MKKAVVVTGNKQYLVSEGDVLDVDFLASVEKDSIQLDVLAIIDGENTSFGAPILDKTKVTAQIVEKEIKQDKVTSIRYKAKKRVHKVRGHRQKVTKIKISSIK